MDQLSRQEIQTKCEQYKINENDFITNGKVQQALNKIESKLDKSVIALDNLGCEVISELIKTGRIAIPNLLKFDHCSSNIYQIINELLANDISEVEITEYWGNTFQLRISKKENISIGFLFGFFDEIQTKFRISEYSISQTSMEQIFNNFANQDDFGNNVNDENKANLNKNHKPILKLNKNTLNQYIKL
jgi:ATP-binding cassette subfamily A (ABC1) protein 3